MTLRPSARPPPRQARLCPEGAEGTVYALVTSVQGVGGTVGGCWSKLATDLCGVQDYDWSSLWQLTLVTSGAKLLCFPLLPLVPRGRDDDATTDERRSAAAGVAVGLLFVGGLVYALVEVALAI